MPCPPGHTCHAPTPCCPNQPPPLEPAQPPVRTPPLLLRVQDVGDQLQLSRAAVQRLLSSGALPSVTVGRSRRVRYDDLCSFVEQLPHTGAIAPHQAPSR